MPNPDRLHGCEVGEFHPHPMEVRFFYDWFACPSVQIFGQARVIVASALALSRAARAPPRRSTPFVRAIVPARSHGLDLDATRGFPIGRPSASRARSAPRRRSLVVAKGHRHVLEHVQEVLALPVAVPRGRAPGKARGGVRRQRARRREQKEASRDVRGGDGGGARGGRRRAPRRSDARESQSPLHALRALRARNRVPSRARRRERLGDEPDRLR